MENYKNKNEEIEQYKQWIEHDEKKIKELKATIRIRIERVKRYKIKIKELENEL